VKSQTPASDALYERPLVTRKLVFEVLALALAHDPVDAIDDVQLALDVLIERERVHRGGLRK